MRLTAKTVLITGASTGIGRALALQLARQECRLILIARREELLKQLIDETSGKERHLYFVCDVAVENNVDLVCKRLLELDVVPDVLILNAGVGGGYRPLQMDMEDIRRQFEVNFWHPLYFLRGLLPAMLKKNSGIVAVTSSLAAYRGMPRSAPYSASKSAINHFLESLRVDLWGSGLQFTLISPGFVKTPMTDRNNYPMPFMISAEKAAKIIVRGLQRGQSEIRFPKPMVAIILLAKLIPNLWWARTMHGRRDD